MFSTSFHISSICSISFHNFLLYLTNLFTIQPTFLPHFPYHFTIQLTFLPYFPCLFTIQLIFLLYFPYLFTIQLLSLTIVKISLKILIWEKINKKLKKN
jgi:hypothetical protein